jgi:hypothetical protein
MDTSVMTGRLIYQEIGRLKTEQDELYRAAESVRDELGDTSTAYELLIKTAQDKEKELNKLYNRKFTPYQQDTSAFEYKGGFK